MDHVATDLPASVASGQVMLVCAVLVGFVLVVCCELVLVLRRKNREAHDDCQVAGV